MNPDGTGQTNLTNSQSINRGPSWSPGGTQIAFSSDRDHSPGTYDIYVMNADGTSQTRVTFDGASSDASWSPDGTKFVFTCAGEICVMNANGSGQTRLTDNPASDGAASWSPDGTKILFGSYHYGNGYELYVMNADGSSKTNLTNTPGNDFFASWSPDGTKIAFYSDRDGDSEIYMMNADGSNQVNLTNKSGYDNQPSWSPDGTRIAFFSIRDGNNHIYVMNADGSQQTRLTNDPLLDQEPSWGPLATPAVIHVNIDIKPGSFPNSINLGSGGTVPVAIFSTPTFDARTVDPLTVTLASAPVKLKGKGTPMASFQDVNGDGLLDVVVHVSTEALQLSQNDTQAVLQGLTFGGTPIEGVDTIRVVP